MSDQHVKGIHLANVFRFVKWKRGILGLRRFQDEIKDQPGCAKATEQTFVEKDWYDYDLYLKLLAAADRTAGNGDLSKVYEIGLWNIRNLGHLSYLTRKPDIHEFSKSATSGWANVYDFGGIEVVEDSPKRMVIRYKGFPQSEVKCQYFRGSNAGMMELCGLEGTVEETACNTKGADYCEFVLSWA
jgi:predicted hydrocarbon binding protein